MPYIGIGNSVLKNRGVSLSSYWMTLISAVVENATPTKIALTFPSPKTSLVASDFTVTDRTISGIEWVGNVLYLTVTYQFIFGDAPVVTFVKTGQTKSVTNNVADDGNTVTRYNVNSLASVTIDTSMRVGEIADQYGAGASVTQAVTTQRPVMTKEGFWFPGWDEFIKSAAFTYNQPESIYLVVRQIGWTDLYHILDGNVNNTGMVRQRTASPGLQVYAGAESTVDSNLPINQWGIIRVIFDGVNGKFQVDNNAAITGNFGAANMGGITLGRMGSTAARYGRFILADAVFRKGHDSDDYFNAKYLQLKRLHSDKVGYTPPVWQKRGIVLDGSAVYENNASQEPMVLYTETDSIIVGNPCFQMWYSCNSGVLETRGIGYAESKDGISWTRHPNNPILTSNHRPMVLKYEGVYHLYNYAGSHYTSVNLVDWTLIKANAITPSTGYAMANIWVWIEEGTWYCIYEGSITSPANYHLCYATSPDGDNWTNYAGNPIVTNEAGSICGPSIYKDTDSVYHMYCHGSMVNSSGIPTDVYKLRSMDKIHWIFENPFEMPRAEADEGVGTVQGQLADPCVIGVGNKTYLYYTASPDQSTLVWKTKVAVADIPIEQMVRSTSNTILPTPS